MKIILDTSRFDESIEENMNINEKYLEGVKSLKKDWKRIEDAIITRASSLLPFREFTAEITVSIRSLIEEKETEGSIAIDPIFTTQTEAFVSKVSHRVHSMLCLELRKYDIDAIAEEDMDIIRTMETINIEGIGDHIDIDYFLHEDNHSFSNDGYITEFKATLRNIPKVITNLNDILVKISQEASQHEKLGEELREFVPPYGNPLGYYMANIIIKNSLLDEMLRDIGNPFSFFRLYNKAVLKDRVEIPSFSEETINLIEKLEKQYIK
ncbi:MAG: hypothetical protein GOP50_05575 [Candidatus Heimdallarchaeota archaeon]|nr:hypothetical protein [Candidatus Heimdallarchaeota archaeon]